MLIIDEKLLALDASIDELVAALVKSDEVAAYKKARQAFEADENLQQQLKILADNEDYLEFRPDLQELQKQLVFDKKVYALRLAENDVQSILSNLTKKISQAISPYIFVDENLPLKGGSRHERHHRTDKS